MLETNYTISKKWLITTIVVWELIFWSCCLILLISTGFFNQKILEQQIGFQHPVAFWLLLIIPILWLFLRRSVLFNNRFAEKTNPRLQHLLLRPKSTSSEFMRYFFIRNTFVFLVFALAQPVYGTKKIPATTQRLELIVCMDISNSMNTKDITPDASRLEIAKRAILAMIQKLKGEKIGLCVFAGSAFVQLPVTSDYLSAKLFIQEIETSMLSNQGTNISAALETALEMFSKEQTGKGILLVTDGEHHEENPTVIAEKIKSAGIQLAVVGIGTKNGGFVPLEPNRPELGYKKNAADQPVLSRVNPNFIASLATTANGSSVVYAEPFPDFTELLTEINQLKRSKTLNLIFEAKESHYQTPLLLAVLFWCMHLLYFPAFTVKPKMKFLQTKNEK
jgi:Ca-activated chloride channel family protein